MQRERSSLSPGAGMAPVERAKNRLTGVLDDDEIMRASDLINMPHVGHVAGEVHRHDGLRSRCQRRLDLLDVHAEGVIAVDKYGPRPDFANCPYGCYKCVSGRDDVVTRSDAESLQRQ